MNKNVAGQKVALVVYNADATPKTTGTVDAYYEGDGGSQTIGSASSGACTHKGNGSWEYSPTQGETNFDSVHWVLVPDSGVPADVMIYPKAVSASVSQTADAFLARNIAGGGNGTRTVAEALKALRNKTAISSGTLTVYEADDTTPAWTATVTTAAGDPLSGIDPA